MEKVFRNINFNSEPNLGQTKDRNRRLKQLLEDFNKPELDMRPGRVAEDIIGNTYIYLIERFAADSGKKAGEFCVSPGEDPLSDALGGNRVMIVGPTGVGKTTTIAKIAGV